MSRILVVLALMGAAATTCLGQDAAAPPAAAAGHANGEQEAAAPAAGAPPVADQAAAVPGAEAEPAVAAPPPSAEAVAANAAFEALVEKWPPLIAELKTAQQQRDAAQGQARADLEVKMADLRGQSSELLDQIAVAGLAVYKLDPLAFPRVNGQLLTIAKFHVIGDANGDGGDQYEKALPLTKGLIEAGAGEKFPMLYLLAGMSAYCTGELDLAEEYLSRAERDGAFAGLGDATGDEPPGLKLLYDAHNYVHHLPQHRQHWEAEQKIRAAEDAADDLPRVKLTTTKGDIVLELFENEAPQAVASFLTLVKQGFYEGVPFHRVLPLFMAQGGDPSGTGEGGPGYNLRDEYELPNARRHFRGSLAMARSQAPNSSGSQFYITFVPTSMLDGGYTVFGRVLEGVDVAASLRRRNPDPRVPGPKPIPDKIIKAEVLRDRGHAYEFEKMPD